MVKDDLYAYMITFPALLALVPANAIGWIEVPEGVGYPKIQFKCISAPLDSLNKDEWQRWRFFTVSPDPEECETVAALIKTIFDGVSGVFVVGGQHYDFITLIEKFEISKRDDSNYEIYQDFRVLYH